MTWTSPGRGRSWLSPTQHQPPAPPQRPLPPVPTEDPLDELSPSERDEQLWAELDDPDGLELRAVETDADTTDDVLSELLRTGDTTWTLDLDDPYAWKDRPNPVAV